MIFASYKFPRLLVPVTLAMFLSAAAWADGVIVDSSVSGSPGAFTYSYEIENQTSLRLLLFSVTFTGDLGAIHSPTGWPTATGIPAPGETIVQWVSAVDPYDVPAFGTLSGFSLTSDSGPGTVTFSTFDVDFNEFAGQTTGPVASTVPEPNSLALLVTGLIGIYAWRLCALRRVRNARIR